MLDVKCECECECECGMTIIKKKELRFVRGWKMLEGRLSRLL